MANKAQDARSICTNGNQASAALLARSFEEETDDDKMVYTNREFRRPRRQELDFATHLVWTTATSTLRRLPTQVELKLHDPLLMEGADPRPNTRNIDPGG